DEVHVMGLDLKGRYIAHTLAGSPNIPNVHFFIHKHFFWRDAARDGRTLTITMKKRKQYDTRYGVKPEYTGDWTGNSENRPLNEGHITNLIVTVPAGYVIQALEPIVHRLDHRSTICLIQDALGVAQDVAETLFPDELRRPTIVLGHETSTLRHMPEQNELIKSGHLGVELGTRRKLVLTLPPPEMYFKGSGPPIRYHPRKHRVLRTTSFFRLLETVPALQATPCRFSNFLRDYKLKMVALRAIADPVATLLDITYDKFAEHSYARRLVENCLGEMCEVISRLPEFKDDWSRRFSKARLTGELRRELFEVIKNQQTADSRMRVQVNRGMMTDIDYTTGYLVKRGRELGAKVDALETLMLAVKAKQLVALQRQDVCIPFKEYFKRQPSGQLDPGSRRTQKEEGRVAEEEEHTVEGEPHVEKSEVTVPESQDPQETRGPLAEAEERKVEEEKDLVEAYENLRDGMRV
ncbi:hypothetical protein B0T16DRAFT_316400, partial [Cercophora newfieldiana]